VHVVDASAPDPVHDIDVIDAELASYAEALGKRRQVLAFNKMDIPEAEAKRAELVAAADRLGRPYAFIAAAARQGTAELAKLAFEELERVRELEPQPAAAADIEVLRPRPRGPQFTIEREDGAFRVVGERPVVLVEMLALQSDDSRAEAMRRLGRMGVVAALKRAGAREGDAVRFGDIELRWEA
jgi:GTP-binding protein